MRDFSQSESLTHISTGSNVMEMSSALVGPNVSPHYICPIAFQMCTFATILVGSPPGVLSLIHWVLVTPYGIGDLGQHWFR